MKKIFMLIPVLMLMACTSAPTPKPGVSELSDRVVYRTQGYYNAAVVVETAYAKLPRCGKPTSPILCSDIAVVKKLRSVDEIAWVAISEAQTAVRTPGFAENKVTTFVASATALTKAFTDIVHTLPKKE